MQLNNQRLTLCLIWLCLWYVLSVDGWSRERESGSHLRPQHRTVIQRWLKRQPELRLAIEEDVVYKEGLVEERRRQKRNYHPYYIAGDFNGDGSEDFAVALIDKRRRKGKFCIAIFNGPLTRAGRPAFFARGFDLGYNGFFFGPPAPSGMPLAMAPFVGDHAMYLHPREKSYRIEVDPGPDL